MTLATMTSKGQVTIPKQVRQALNLRAGDKLDIVVTGKGEAVIRPVAKRVDDLFGKLHEPGRKATSIEDMNLAIGKRMKARFG